MSDQNVSERLKQFIENKGLSYSQFADMCGIPRPSLSQFLTGRNKKISDVMVGQIHNMFPELSIVWLLFGEGKMKNELPGTKINAKTNDESGYAGYQFSDEEILEGSDSKKIIFSNDEGKEEGKFSKENGLKNVVSSNQVTDIKVETLQNKIKELQKQIEILVKNPRKVNHITIYYDDSTFETFYPK